LAPENKFSVKQKGMVYEYARGNQASFERPAVNQQGVAFFAQRRNELVHDAARHVGKLVFGLLAANGFGRRVHHVASPADQLQKRMRRNLSAAILVDEYCFCCFGGTSRAADDDKPPPMGTLVATAISNAGTASSAVLVWFGLVLLLLGFYI
jgi:hypothetical protein